MGRGTGTFNPYTPDSGVRPPELRGRDSELAHLQSIVTELRAGGTERHVLITGLRGVGKTVLLNEFEVMCQEAGWFADAKEVGTTSNISTLVGNVTRKALLHMSGKARVQKKLRTALSALKSFEVSVGGLAFKLEVEPAVGVADSGDLVEDLRDLFVTVGEAAAEAGLGFAFILDEVHNLGHDDFEALIVGLHRTKQKRLPVAFVGAGLPLLPRLTGEAKTYAERMFVWPEIGALPEDEARAALVLPAERQGVRWADDAAAEVVDYTEGYPFFIQEFGRHAWAQNTDTRITAEDVRAARPVVEADLDDNFFDLRIGRLTETERAYVATMASLGDGPQRSGAVAKHLGKSAQAVSSIRDDLLNGAVIYAPKRGFVDFTVPHCASYVRRRYP